MSNIINCPHCKGKIKIKEIWKDIASTIGKIGGKKSGEKRKGNSEYMRELAKKRWQKIPQKPK